MARTKTSILKTLAAEDSEAPTETAEPQQPPEAEQTEETPAEPEPKRKPSRRAPARKSTRRQGAAQPAAPAEAKDAEPTDSGSSPKREGPHVRKPESTTAASRISLYLHPDDKRELGLAKVDDAIDENSRIRAMIALWRHDERLRSRIDRLAKQSRNSR